ncbi:chromate transporter [Falsiroseomonas selenitidurans]|uniref:Chromate transporter n=1 Tax=Falsiroseomonas selenitidurans TaxID=2716335 RepID=A0ABX1E3N1_9PROT|nr:chromate transporter [Falsiroseomonas selenitidurans]NKC31787.1 chromate transporter [Falsiroseomonas selenitidurans]
MADNPPQESEPAPPARPRPGVAALFLTYLRIGLIGFGGVNAWARRVLVEEKRWVTEQEYAEVLGLGQVLPGPNALNVAIHLGERFRGGPGALAASVGLFGGPMLVLLGLAMLHDQYGEVPVVKAVLAGIAAAAAGMILGTAAKITEKLRPAWPILAVGLAALLAGAVLRLPLPAIVLGLAPFGIAAAWWTRR